MRDLKKYSNDQLLRKLELCEKCINNLLQVRSDLSILGITCTEFDNARWHQISKIQSLVLEIRSEATRRNAVVGAEQINLFI